MGETFVGLVRNIPTLTLCVRSCTKSGVLYVLAWSELVKMLQNISYGSNLFAMCYPYICRSRQDSMSLLSQTFSLVILQITILHFNDSISGTSINWAPITWEMTQDGSARFPHKTREKQRCARAGAQKSCDWGELEGLTAAFVCSSLAIIMPNFPYSNVHA